ncbi:helix-turn-helix domain-containing protein [Salinibacterium sp. SWN1162]|uniref:helix-turn-helix domain-containing protein n=1 Tax=Salinibacterium sp. SWN1162 TaxID=2792053 RepID=UPI0018CC83D4|nr:helix-turn-helix domain-containing protein [Salinibacterium sp. SWN1162]MBH0008069.1 helix-turn-helix domain-containing protein [Salinibacterium sp. SWN1162]
MTVSTVARSSVTITDELRAEAVEVVAEVGDEKFSGVTITTETGRSIQLPAGFAELLDSVVHRVQQGGRVVLESMPELLTTSNAADVLGVSRPTLVKLITDGKLPAVNRGTHRRVRWSDLSEFKQARETARSVAIEELLEADFGGE